MSYTILLNWLNYKRYNNNHNERYNNNRNEKIVICDQLLSIFFTLQNEKLSYWILSQCLLKRAIKLRGNKHKCINKIIRSALCFLRCRKSIPWIEGNIRSWLLSFYVDHFVANVTEITRGARFRCVFSINVYSSLDQQTLRMRTSRIDSPSTREIHKPLLHACLPFFDD